MKGSSQVRLEVLLTGEREKKGAVGRVNDRGLGRRGKRGGEGDSGGKKGGIYLDHPLPEGLGKVGPFHTEGEGRKLLKRTKKHKKETRKA